MLKSIYVLYILIKMTNLLIGEPSNLISGLGAALITNSSHTPQLLSTTTHKLPNIILGVTYAVTYSNRLDLVVTYL